MTSKVYITTNNLDDMVTIWHDCQKPHYDDNADKWVSEDADIFNRQTAFISNITYLIPTKVEEFQCYELSITLNTQDNE